jgi:hypothetical protein
MNQDFPLFSLTQPQNAKRRPVKFPLVPLARERLSSEKKYLKL